MTLSRVHTSAEAADVAKLLLLIKRQVTDPAMRNIVRAQPSRKTNHNQRDPDYHYNLTVSSMAHSATFPSNLLKIGWVDFAHSC